GAAADHDYGPSVPLSLELECSGGDVMAMHGLALRPNPTSSLSAETGGGFWRSPRSNEVLRPVGIGDEAAVACRDALGCWGWIKAYRDKSDRPFDEQNLELLADVGPNMGSALRRNAIGPGGGSAFEPSPPRVIVLARDLPRVSW